MKYISGWSKIKKTKGHRSGGPLLLRPGDDVPADIAISSGLDDEEPESMRES